VHRLADEFLTGIAQQYPWEETRFTEDLESVANPKNTASIYRVPYHRLHHRRKACNGSGPQIVTVRKSSRQNDTILGCEVSEIGLFVPQHPHFCTHDSPKDVLHIMIAIRSGENNDAKFH
jgi:hypothetical protein